MDNYRLKYLAVRSVISKREDSQGDTTGIITSSLKYLALRSVISRREDSQGGITDIITFCLKYLAVNGVIQLREVAVSLLQLRVRLFKPFVVRLELGVLFPQRLLLCLQNGQSGLQAVHLGTGLSLAVARETGAGGGVGRHPTGVGPAFRWRRQQQREVVSCETCARQDCS